MHTYNHEKIQLDLNTQKKKKKTWALFKLKPAMQCSGFCSWMDGN